MTKEKIREEKRKIVVFHIVDIAEEVFFSKGYDVATVDEIAKRSKMTKKTIYSYLSGKEEIYDIIAVRGYNTLLEHLLAAQDAAAGPKENLINFFNGSFAFATKYEGYAKVITNYHLRSKNRNFDNPSYKYINEINTTILRIIENTLRQGVRQNVFKKNINVKMTAVYFTAVFTGLADMVFNKTYYLEHKLKINNKKFMTESILLAVSSILNKENV